MGRKVLQVEKSPLITSECWTYYKSIVMQTSECFDMWLACHMNINMKDDIVMFGEFAEYPLSYYGEILEMKEQSIQTITEDGIVKYLMEQIDKGYHIMIDLNFRRIDDLNAVRFDLHETLIYGYDTEYKEFWTSRLRQGSFKENRISFEAVQKAYADVYERYYNNYRRLFARRYYFVPITLIKPKHDYENLNAHFDFIEKLKKELMGEIYTVYQWITDSEEKKSVVYKGLSLVQHLAEVLREAVSCSEEEREKNNREYYCGCLKVYEHRNIICRSMQWFLDTIDNDCERLQELVDRYRECCDKARVNVHLMQKYLITKNSHLLLRVADALENLLPVEREILAEFVDTAPVVYGRKKLVN